MKTTFKLAFVACLMVLSSACHAQKPIPNIDQAFDKFVQDLSQDDLVTSSTMNTYNIGMMKGFEFAVPGKKQKMVDTFHKALLSNSRLAYISFTKKAGSASIETNRVGYGNNNSATYLFGAHLLCGCWCVCAPVVGICKGCFRCDGCIGSKFDV